MKFESIYKSHADRMYSIGEAQDTLRKAGYDYENGLQTVIHYCRFATIWLQFTPMLGVRVEMRDYNGNKLVPTFIVSYESKDWCTQLLDEITCVLTN